MAYDLRLRWTLTDTFNHECINPFVGKLSARALNQRLEP